ncbi:MAG: HigA family addiction module antitoxin [Microcoleaceae cyanobacterium]
MKEPPTHPGEMLLEEFLKPMGISQVQLANSIGVTTQRVNELINKKRDVTSSTALRLGKYLNTSAQLWLNLQQNWDLWHALQKEKSELDKIIPASKV